MAQQSGKEKEKEKAAAIADEVLLGSEYKFVEAHNITNVTAERGPREEERDSFSLTHSLTICVSNRSPDHYYLSVLFLSIFFLF